MPDKLRVGIVGCGTLLFLLRERQKEEIQELCAMRERILRR